MLEVDNSKEKRICINHYEQNHYRRSKTKPTSVLQPKNKNNVVKSNVNKPSVMSILSNVPNIPKVSSMINDKVKAFNFADGIKPHFLQHVFVDEKDSEWH